ncbi:MAG: metallophosphoesterase [Planctomycetaceae bacterium]|nr:metallophosphoesterase [Planctomycetaceae bacterium]
MNRNTKPFGLSVLGLIIALAWSATGVAAHDGPDPLCHWTFRAEQLDGQKLKSRLGPDGLFSHAPEVTRDPWGQSAFFSGRQTQCVITEDWTQIKDFLPVQSMTVATWVAVDRPEEWGGLVGTIQDNGDAETGWVLGYNQEVFTFAISSQGANDGDGKMTYLQGKTKYVPGKFYQVVGVYDGETMQLYVNGQLDAESKEQSGDLLYPTSAPFVVGAYRDRDEFNSFRGKLREVAIYNMAAKAKWVAHDFEHLQELANAQPVAVQQELDFIVRPFLQFGTPTGMSVVWQTTMPATSEIHWGTTIECDQVAPTTANGEIYTGRIEGLEPNTQYFYRVVSTTADGKKLESDPSTFQTAFGPGTPVTFAVISDTQKNPKVAGAIAEHAWAQRPHFLLLPGDLVDQGKKDSDWREEFFPSLNPLISRIPLFPVLGNHEQNAKNYFDYMALPDPEYYYTFSYGDADFFVIDSNRKVDPESEQYRWLEEKLAASKATWKFVSHHHPPYSSDENDYGDLWKTNQSTRGDLRARQLVPLYEKYGVDIVWTGHIHSYERTWPIKDGQAVSAGGTIYMITGGGGGGLETPGPYRPFFQNNVRRTHHYVMVHIQDKTLELRAFTLEDQLFDTVRLQKP